MSAKPETQAQAAAFERRLRSYRRDGLCLPCGVAGAYGPVDGWGTARKPCATCLPLVQALAEAGPRMLASRKWLRLATGRPLIGLSATPRVEVPEVVADMPAGQAVA